MSKMKHRAFPYNPIGMFKTAGVRPFKPYLLPQDTRTQRWKKRKAERANEKTFQKFLQTEAMRRSINLTTLQLFMANSNNRDAYEEIQNGSDLHLHIDAYSGGNHLFISNFDEDNYKDYLGLTSKLILQPYIDLGRTVIIATTKKNRVFKPLEFLQVEGKISFAYIHEDFPKADLIIIQDANDIYDNANVMKALHDNSQKVLIIAEEDSYERGFSSEANLFDLVKKYIPAEISTVNIYDAKKTDSYLEIKGDSIYNFKNGSRRFEHEDLRNILVDDNTRIKDIKFVDGNMFLRSFSIHIGNRFSERWHEIKDKNLYFTNDEIAAIVDQDEDKTEITSLPGVRVSFTVRNIIGWK